MRAVELFENKRKQLKEAYQPSEFEMIERISYDISKHNWNLLSSNFHRFGIKNLNNVPKVIDLINDNKESALAFCNRDVKMFGQSYFAVNSLQLLFDLNKVKYIPNWLHEFFIENKHNIIRSILQIVKHDHNNIYSLKIINEYVSSALGIFKWPELNIIKKSIDHIIKSSPPNQIP